jgi:hypothetical protein
MLSLRIVLSVGFLGDRLLLNMIKVVVRSRPLDFFFTYLLEHREMTSVGILLSKLDPTPRLLLLETIQ